MKIQSFVVCFMLFSSLSWGKATSDTLLVAYAQAAPFIIKSEDRLSGINVWLWDRISRDLDLNYKLVEMDFSSMLEALKKQEIDVCINPLTITSERSTTMEFTHSFYASNSTIAVVDKGSFSKFIGFIGSFFNRNFLRGILILISVIALFGLATWAFEHRKNPTHFRPGWRGFFDGMWWSVVTMTTVGYGDKYPKSRGGKVVALVWMFSGLLFVSGLTASVASSLTVMNLENEVQDFNKFKNKEVGSIESSSSIAFLKDNFFNKVRTYTSVDAGLSDLSEKNIHAFLYDEPILKYRLNNQDQFDNIKLLPIKFDLQLYAFGLPKKHAALEQLISQKILEITESHEWRVVLNEFGLNQI